MQSFTGLVKTPAKPIKTDFFELGCIHDFYQMPVSQSPFSDMGHKIGKHLEAIAMLIIGQGVYDLITVKLVANRRSACRQGAAG